MNFQNNNFKKVSKYVIKFGISDPYYIAKWGGDPGRTYSIKSARKFLSRSFAENSAQRIIAKYPERYSNETYFEIKAHNG